jgi:hypothetical protein
VGGRAYVLEERHKWLRTIALDHLDSPRDFWRKIDALPTLRTEIPAAARRALEQMLPKPLFGQCARRQVQIALLPPGRAQAHADGAAFLASMASWSPYQKMLKYAVRCPDPFVRLTGKWLVHQLSPDASPIEIESMSGQKNHDKLLHAMAWEAANVHQGTPRAISWIKNDLRKRRANWFRSAVKDMTKKTIEDWKEWKLSRKSRR